METELVQKFKYWLLDLIKKVNVLFISIVNFMDNEATFFFYIRRGEGIVKEKVTYSLK